MSLKQKQGSQTRSDILEAAFTEIHEQGFRAASLDNILKKTNVSKGALYYHFPNKKALGYAVFEEVIKPYAYDRWLWEKLDDPSNNPIDVFEEIAKQMLNDTTEAMIQLGCPICNLSNEMSGVDEGFQERFLNMHEQWRDHLTRALKRGQENNQIVKDVNAEEVAVFLMSTHDGASSISKATQSLQTYKYCINQLARYVQGLRINPNN